MKKLINTLMLVCFLLVCQHNVQAQSVSLGEQNTANSSLESLYQNPKAKNKSTYTTDLGTTTDASSALSSNKKDNKKSKKKSSKQNKENTLALGQDTESTTSIVVEKVAEPEVIVINEVVEVPKVIVKEEVVEEPKVVVVKEEVVEEPNVVVVKQVVKEQQPSSEPSLARIPRNYTKFIATEMVGKDSRLAWISYKYYGVKDFWVYLYEANLDRVSDPNYVKPGQKIRIPALDSKYSNLNDPEVKKLLVHLSNEYLKR